jgi:hypothetical protein
MGEPAQQIGAHLPPLGAGGKERLLDESGGSQPAHRQLDPGDGFLLRQRGQDPVEQTPGRSMERGHRRVPYAVAGHATIPGRFAIDWMKIDAKGRFDRSDGKTLADSLSYGAEVLAVADAVVSATRDDFAEPELRAEEYRASARRS